MRMPRLGLTFLIVLLSLGALIGAAGATQPSASCASAKCQVYLSLIAYQPQVVLLAPAGGAAISSLAPVLVWRPPVTGLYRIQVTEDSAFTPSGSFAVSETKDLKSPLPAQVITLMNSNLNPRRTYYWRVEKTGKDSELFTASASFITPAKDDRLLPPGVKLLSPANNSSVAAQSVLLSWQPVAGALYYRIRVYDPNNVQVSGLPAEVGGTTTSIGVPNLTPGVIYHWKVKALNAYGWGEYLPDHYFKVT